MCSSSRKIGGGGKRRDRAQTAASFASPARVTESFQPPSVAGMVDRGGGQLSQWDGSEQQCVEETQKNTAQPDPQKLRCAVSPQRREQEGEGSFGCRLRFDTKQTDRGTLQFVAALEIWTSTSDSKHLLQCFTRCTRLFSVNFPPPFE